MIRVRYPLLTALLFLVANVPIHAQDREGAPSSFVWNPALSPSGPVIVWVNLKPQTAAVSRGGIEIGSCLVSTGKEGFETPTGVFHVLDKDADHHSSIYNNASMPYTERLTSGGVALHAGGLPGYPSSHGCVHFGMGVRLDVSARSEDSEDDFLLFGDLQTSRRILGRASSIGCFGQIV